MKTIAFIRWDIYNEMGMIGMQEIRRKVYVSVLAEMTPTGYAQPRVITWEDGTHYEIDQVKDVRKAASLKAGGAGIRYRVRIGRTETNLYLEENRWFVEGK